LLQEVLQEGAGLAQEGHEFLLISGPLVLVGWKVGLVLRGVLPSKIEVIFGFKG